MDKQITVSFSMIANIIHFHLVSIINIGTEYADMIKSLFSNKLAITRKTLLCLSSIQRKNMVQSNNNACGFVQYTYCDVPTMVKLNPDHNIRVKYWLSNLKNSFSKNVRHTTIAPIQNNESLIFFLKHPNRESL